MSENTTIKPKYNFKVHLEQMKQKATNQTLHKNQFLRYIRRYSIFVIVN